MTEYQCTDYGTFFFYFFGGYLGLVHLTTFVYRLEGMDEGQYDACGPRKCCSIAAFYGLLSHTVRFLA